MPDKPKVALYWASSCGGCEIAAANLHERFLEVFAQLDLVFCPCLVDTKKRDVESLPDGAIVITLFNGAIRTADNVAMAQLLRRKSQVLVAFGACAQGGGVPALANLASRDDLLDAVYRDNPSTENPDGVIPREATRVPEGTLELPGLHARVTNLAQVVPVDYSVPGCPPEAEQIGNVLRLFLSGAPLPPAGSVLGAGPSTVCDECKRTRSDKKITRFRRVWEFVPDPDVCLIEQGLLCAGVATRGGCGGLCPKVNMPCIGCYGAPEGVYDQSAKLVSMIGSVLDIAPIRDLRDDEEIARRVDAVLAHIPDIAGLAGKFTLGTRARPGQPVRERAPEEVTR